jgi:hypothetical protein
MQIISNFATIAIPRMCNGGGDRAIVAADGHNVLIVKEMLNYGSLGEGDWMGVDAGSGIAGLDGRLECRDWMQGLDK